jgi:hypothetical protein
LAAAEVGISACKRRAIPEWPDTSMQRACGRTMTEREINRQALKEALENDQVYYCLKTFAKLMGIASIFAVGLFLTVAYFAWGK